MHLSWLCAAIDLRSYHRPLFEHEIALVDSKLPRFAVPAVPAEPELELQLAHHNSGETSPFL